MVKILECKRCGYIAKQSQALKTHLKKKNVCKPILLDIDREILLKEFDIKPDKIYECNKCKKTFSCNQNKWRHEKTCTFVSKEIEKDDKIKKLENELIEIKKQIQNSKTINNYNNCNNQIINNIIITDTELRPFGKENYDYISEDMILNNLRPSQHLLFKLFQSVHFNGNHPENWNFYISNSTKNKALVYRGKRFELEDKNKTILELISNKIKFLENFLKNLEGLSEIQKDNVIDSINNYTKIYDDIHKYDIKDLIQKISEYAYNKKEKLELLKKEIDKKNKAETKITLQNIN